MNGATALPLLVAGAEAFERYFSASQVETFLLCKRKWSWSRIAGIRGPQATSAQIGDAMHKQLERYLAGGALDFMQVVHGVNVGNVAASGVHLLPEPNAPGMKIETSFSFVSPATGFKWIGRKDVELEDSIVMPGLEGGMPGVTDHKSTSGLQWAKEPEDLEWDAQANLYAHETCERTNAPAADLAWVYYQTRGGKASKRTHLRVSREHAARAFAVIEDVAREMTAIGDAAPKVMSITREHRAFDDGPVPPERLRAPDVAARDQAALEAYVQTLPATPSACRAFGGCHYQHMCQLTPAESRKAAFMSEASWIDSLKARAAEADGTPAPTMGMSDRDVPAPSEVPAWLLAPPKDPVGADAHAAINPPESKSAPPVLPPEPTPPAATAPTETPEEKKARQKKERADKKAAKAVVEEAQKTIDACADAAVGATTIVNNVITSAPTCTAHGDAFEGCADDGAKRTGAMFTLYIDCMPVNVPAAPLEEYIARAQEKIRATLKTDKGEAIEDFRFIPFGQGGGALALAVLEALEENPPTRLVANTGCEETRHVLATLRTRAGVVVMGTR